MNSEFEELKKFALKNIVQAGEAAHASQRDYLRKLYRKVKSSKTIDDIFLSVEEVYYETPYEKSLIKNWPNQKYFIHWLKTHLVSFLLDLEHDTDYTGYYIGYEYHEPDTGSEWEEQEIEKELTYR